ncbi:MAG: DEAD/DEAH box helicase [Alistipes sp.]
MTPRLLDIERRTTSSQAQTGTGKTAAFGLPILERLRPLKGAAQALILVPTRELALQVTEELLSLNGRSKLSISAIYGGASMSEQLRRLSKGVDVVVGTPGRILDHLHRGTLDIRELQYLILDEADEMLNMGFIEDIEEILSHANDRRRILLFSATMPERIISLSKKYMRDSELLRVPSQEMTTELTDQIYFEVRDSDKFDALTRIIDTEPEFYGIVFSRTKVGVDELVNRLTERGYAAEGCTATFRRAEGENPPQFKKKLANILVATDVAARGIDINNLTHVINYCCRRTPSRTSIGSAGPAARNTGTAVMFISPPSSATWLPQARHRRRSKGKPASAQDVIEIKKTKIKDDLARSSRTDRTKSTGKWPPRCFRSAPEVALASLLQLAFNNELDESRYPRFARSTSTGREPPGCFWRSAGRTGTMPASWPSFCGASAGCPTVRSAICGCWRAIRSYRFRSRRPARRSAG